MAHSYQVGLMEKILNDGGKSKKMVAVFSNREFFSNGTWDAKIF